MNAPSTRQLVLDTETTGLEVSQGHRIIEVGCVELLNRRPTGNNFWEYINPQRPIDEDAIRVHGITNESLVDKPAFGKIAAALFDYLQGAELIIHNAAFDVGFLDAEFARAGVGRPLGQVCRITDTVTMARRLYPGQKASLDALCRRLSVDNSGRELHGALLDARLLADVYLLMTGGQSALGLASEEAAAGSTGSAGFDWAAALGGEPGPLRVVQPSDDEWQAHRERLGKIAGKSGGKLIWSADLPPG